MDYKTRQSIRVLGSASRLTKLVHLGAPTLLIEQELKHLVKAASGMVAEMQATTPKYTEQVQKLLTEEAFKEGQEQAELWRTATDEEREFSVDAGVTSLHRALESIGQIIEEHYADWELVEGEE